MTPAAMQQPNKQYTLDIHRMHDGIWCALVLPRYGNQALARAFAPSAREAKRAAVKRAREYGYCRYRAEAA